MRILVEPSDYRLLNRGDAASLFVALERLRGLWPGSEIEVLTEDPDVLRVIAPTVIPRVTARWQPASDGEESLGRLQQRIRRMPLRLRSRGAAVEAVARADLVVVAGMGGITDAFRGYAVGVLATLATAARHNVPTVMMSQQIGPLSSLRLHRMARDVLPTVALIALRERKAGLPLLRRLGVDLGGVRTTGDDTVGFVHPLRAPHLGEGLGLNLRRSGYASVDAGIVRRVGMVVRSASAGLNAPLIGLPVSHRGEEDDARTIASMTGQSPPSHPPITDLETFVSFMQSCRVVVSGSYHGAVFALAQGIPAVCLSNSPYYSQKFLGLQDLFGEGCVVVRVTSTMERDLRDATERLWVSAPGLRPALLDAAARQAEASRTAYASLPTLVGATR